MSCSLNMGVTWQQSRRSLVKETLDGRTRRCADEQTKRLNEQVKRNQDRFPADFMFQLTSEEAHRFHGRHRQETVAICAKA
jgi:ORF6N domain